MSGRSEGRIADLLLAKLAVILFVNGQTSEALRASVRRLGGALGRDGQVFAHWGILATTREDGRGFRGWRWPGRSNGARHGKA